MNQLSIVQFQTTSDETVDKIFTFIFQLFPLFALLVGGGCQGPVLGGFSWVDHWWVGALLGWRVGVPTVWLQTTAT